MVPQVLPVHLFFRRGVTSRAFYSPVVLMVTDHKLPRLHGFESNIYGAPSFTCTIPSLEGASV